MFEEDGKLWFCTSNQKEVYRELQKQSYVELCASDGTMSWLRLEGKAAFTDNLAAKIKVFKIDPLVNGIYNEPANPAFEVFYLKDLKASIHEIGKSPRIYTMS